MLDRSSMRKWIYKKLSNQELTGERRTVYRAERKIGASKGDAMTICVATLSQGGNAILATSDRLLTAGDLTSEPGQTKHFHVAPHILALVASENIAFSLPILNNLYKFASAQKAQDLTVKGVADKYCDIFRDTRNRAVEATILSLHDLDFASFLRHQRSMDPGIVADLWRKIKSFPIPKTEVIFAGADEPGTPQAKGHLYIAENDQLSCEDAAGYAAIGEGAYHAQSQLVRVHYSRFTPGHESLYLTYAAKRRSEVVKSVGTYTDLLSLILPVKPTWESVPQTVVGHLKALYEIQIGKEASAGAEAIETMRQASRTATTPPTVAPATPTPEVTTPTSAPPVQQTPKKTPKKKKGG